MTIKRKFRDMFISCPSKKMSYLDFISEGEVEIELTPEEMNQICAESRQKKVSNCDQSMTNEQASAALEQIAVDLTGCLAGMRKDNPAAAGIEQKIKAIDLAQAALHKDNA